MAMATMSSTFWDITTCSAARAKRCVGGIYWLHLQGRCHARHQHEVGIKKTLLGLLFDPEDRMIQDKEDEMGRACSSNGGEEECV
jgi:hypothetical protein